MVRSIILVLIVTYSVSVAVLYWWPGAWNGGSPIPEALGRHSPGTPPAQSVIAAPVAETAAVIQPATAPTLLPDGQRSAVPANLTGADPPPESVVQQPLPIAFHIRNRRDLGRIEGDIRNVSAETLSVTLRTGNSGAQRGAELAMSLAPGEKRTYSSDDGLVMHSGDQLVIHAATYQDQVVEVP